MSFFLPVFLAYVVFVNNSFYETNSVLTSSLGLKIFPSFHYLKSLFELNNDVFYSFSGFGGCFDFFAYYLFSPFNLLFFFVSDKTVDLGITNLIILKFGFCGLTFSYFLNKEIKEHPVSILFACFYALCGYNISNTVNIMFYDALILFPLVMLGLSRIIKGEKSFLYCITLTLSIITNCVMGYIIALFSGLFFFYKVAASEKESLKNVKSNFVKYLLETIFAFGVTVWVWLPVISSLNSFNYIFSQNFAQFFAIKTDFLMTLSKLFSSGGVNVASEEFIKAPHVYVGVLALAFVIFFFLSKKFSLREKVATGAFFVILYLSFALNGFLTIWNCGIDYSAFWGDAILIASFVINFMLIYVAYKSFMELDSLSVKDLFVAGLIYFLLAFVVMHKNYVFVDNGYVKFDIVCFCCILYFLYVVNECKELTKSIIPLFLLIVLLNIGVNMDITLKDLYQDKEIMPKIAYSKFYSFFKENLKYIKEKDKSFYRIESDENIVEEGLYQAYRNLPLIFGYNGITEYNSFLDYEKFDFSKNFGVSWYNSCRNHFAYDRNASSLPYSLLGVKYVITSASQMPLSYSKIHSTNSYDKELNVYENNVVFPMAFIIKNNEELYKSFGENNVFELQNKLLKDLAGADYGDVYDVQSFKEVEDVAHFEDFKPIDIEKTFKIDKKRDMFLLISDKNYMNNFYEHVYKDGELFDYHELNKNAYFWLNPDKSKNYFNLRFEQKHLNEWMEGFVKDNFSVLIATENLNLLKKYRAEIAKKPCEIEKISSSHLKIKLNSPQDGQSLFLSIPYDESWKIKVDGEVRNPEKVLDALMIIPLNSGDKELEMWYMPFEFKIGLIISAIFLLLCGIGFVVSKRNNCSLKHE